MLSIVPDSTVVLDINVLVSALINRESPPGRITAAWRRQEIAVITSRPIIDKAVEVLHRPSMSRFGITQLQVSRILLMLNRHTIITPHALDLKAVKDDPEDDKFIIAAVEGKADCIISGDAHLKNLGSYQDIPILTPAEFVTQYNLS